MDVRPRTDDDLDACERLVQLVHDHDDYPPRLVEGLRRFLVSPRALGGWVVEQEREIVGHVALHPTSSAAVMAAASEALGRSGEELVVVARLLVAPGFRRQGIANELLDAATRAARELGRWPILDVATHLAPAVALYERAGWVRVAQVSVTIADTAPLDEFVFVAPGTQSDGQ